MDGRNQSFIERARKIKLVIFDVDGVFTDGTLLMDDNGIETKVFYILDNQGIKFLQQTPVTIAIISGRKSPGGLIHLQKKLGIEHVFLGEINKLPIYEDLLKKLKLTDQEVAFVGDDLPDLPILKRVGLPMTVPGAVPQVMKHVAFVTQNRGGKGAVREVCEAIMSAQGTWETIVKNYV
ncbi:MAG TPA: HAD hydrolase family protein [Gammaproteobacteria bacterium]|nr:HAD hydrolase family protein [Gammaproteobacteria bacterium]